MNRIMMMSLTVGFCCSSLFASFQSVNAEYDKDSASTKTLFICPVNPDSITFLKCDSMLNRFGTTDKEKLERFADMVNHLLLFEILSSVGAVKPLPDYVRFDDLKSKDSSFFTVPLKIGKKASDVTNYSVPNYETVLKNGVDADYVFSISKIAIEFLSGYDRYKANITYIIWDYRKNCAIAHGAISENITEEMKFGTTKWHRCFLSITKRIFSKSPFCFSAKNQMVKYFKIPYSPLFNDDTRPIILLRGERPVKEVLTGLDKGLKEIDKKYALSNSGQSGVLFANMKITGEGTLITTEITQCVPCSTSLPSYIKEELAKSQFTPLEKTTDTTEVLVPIAINQSTTSTLSNDANNSMVAARALGILVSLICSIFLTISLNTHPQYY